jgi:hypothetical protein
MILACPGATDTLDARWSFRTGAGRCAATVDREREARTHKHS